MLSILIGAIINILLDPLFIFVFNKRVEVASLTTVISQFVSFVWIIIYLHSKKSFFRVNLKHFQFDKNVF